MTIIQKIDIEHEIWDRIRRGDIEAFNSMFVHYYSPLCEYASQYIPDTDAEELVQGMMLYLWENREWINVEKSLRTYLFSSVKNRCFNAIRNGRTRKKIHGYIYERLKDQVENPDYYIFEELSRNIEKAIESLPENYRETFRMSRYGEMSNAEIASKLGVSVKTIEYRMTQSLKILRKELKDYFPIILFLIINDIR